ncbi:hypothetical protein BC834DRAFT_668044 [Gloeopeniophorella convolvens]|nr:hypothetical protein BC834DRAFT_668044 [Gloeopeniophorella convolvens]
MERTAGDRRDETTQGSLADHFPDDVLLRVFDFYRLAAPSPMETGWTWPWQSLAHVCHRWRHLIISSHKRLKLDLHITHGAPVASILRLPPSFAFDVGYWNEAYNDDSDGDETDDESDDDVSEEDSDANRSDTEDGMEAQGIEPRVLVSWSPEDINAVALAFESPDRIRNIALLADDDVLRQFFTTMTGAAPQLESLRLRAANWPCSPHIFPDNFLAEGAPLLRVLNLSGVLPPLPSSLHITQLEFSLEYDFPGGNLSLVSELVERVCQMSRLECLTVQLEAYDFSGRTSVQPPPVVAQVTLPSLTRFVFVGLSTYLELFTCRTVAPKLAEFEIRFEDEAVFIIPSLISFIDHGTMFAGPGMVAHLQFSLKYGGWIKIYSPEDYTRPPIMTFRMRASDVPGPPLGSAAWLLHYIAPVLSFMETLIIKVLDDAPLPNDPDTQWTTYIPEWHMIFMALNSVRHMIVENAFALAVARTLGRPGGIHLLRNLRDLLLLFYSADGYDPSKALTELHPFINAHSTPECPLDVSCQMIPHGTQYPELMEGAFI